MFAIYSIIQKTQKGKLTETKNNFNITALILL
jgi:hypothetical protein